MSNYDNVDVAAQLHLLENRVRVYEAQERQQQAVIGAMGAQLANQERLFSLLERIAVAQEKQAALAQWAHDLANDPARFVEHAIANIRAFEKAEEG